MEMTLNEEIEYLQSGNWYNKVREVLPTDEYLKLGWAIGDILETLELFRSLAPEPLTNADRIRAMSDEELAKVLATPCTCEVDPAYDGFIECGNDLCLKHLLAWLQQPAEED